MARDIDADYLKTLQFPKLALLHGVIRARPLITRLRRMQRMLARPAPGAAAYAGPVVSTALDERGADYMRQGWTFVEPFFTPSFHERLLAGWPKRYYLEPPSDVFKSYDRGLEWCRGRPDPRDLDRHPVLQLAYDHLRSEAFAKRVTAFAGGKHELACYSLIVTRTWPGSNVAPHRDTTAYLPEGEHFLNMVIFIDGSGGDGSGGLAILGDNTFRNATFKSARLRNTALVYATNAPFYHGFEPVRLGKFRWALLAQFCDRAYRD
jgi:hypothetical protein